MPAPAADAVTVFRSHRREPCAERALVLVATGIESEVVESAGEHVLVVADRDATRAARQLALYERENRGWPPPREKPLPRIGSGWPGVAGYVAMLLLVDTLERGRALGLEWHWAGRAHTALIRDGEWWRVLTSLTLHADGPHLVGNLVFGALFGLFTGQLLGSGLAWLSILAAGALGNAINALVQPADHISIGASTAVFGALGIVAAYSGKRRRQAGDRWVHRWGPVVGGILLLAFTGTGGERTDVVAHLTGFFSGCGIGAFYASLGGDLRLRPRVQAGLGAAALGILALVWLLALSVNG